MSVSIIESIKEVIPYIPDIITSASKTPLGVICLMWISICIIAIWFFSGMPVKIKLIIFFSLFAGMSGFAWATLSSWSVIKKGICPLRIETAEYITSENRLAVKITGDASNVEEPKNWELISTSDECNDGVIMQTNDGYEYVKEYCTLPQGVRIKFSYKMKDNKSCNATHEVQFN